jgi:hypothetical protein
MQRRIPYGIMNYAELITKNNYLIDKSRFIEKLRPCKTRYFSAPEDLVNHCSAPCSSIIMISMKLIGLKNYLPTPGLGRTAHPLTICILFSN